MIFQVLIEGGHGPPGKIPALPHITLVFCKGLGERAWERGEGRAGNHRRDACGYRSPALPKKRQSTFHLFQGPAQLFPGLFPVPGFVVFLGEQFEAIGKVAGDDVEVGMEHHLSRGLEIVHLDVEALGV